MSNNPEPLRWRHTIMPLLSLFTSMGKGDLMKLIWWDGTGACLLSKRLEAGRFVWPAARDGTIRPRPAQFSMLFEGIDWRIVKDTARLMRAG